MMFILELGYLGSFEVLFLETTCTHACSLYIESFLVQYCGIITLPELWVVFVIFLSRVMGCVIFEKKPLYFENKSLY